jgi:hypothetical protein
MFSPQVSSGARKSISFMGLRVIVQSERDAPYVESRINAFWDEFRTKLAEMTDVEFEKYKAAVVSRKLEDHKNMWQECVPLSSLYPVLFTPLICPRQPRTDRARCGWPSTRDGTILSSASATPSSSRSCKSPR